MTRRVFELRNELLEFYEQRNHNYEQRIMNKEFYEQRKGPDGRCFHAAWAVSKSVH